MITVSGAITAPLAAAAPPGPDAAAVAVPGAVDASRPAATASDAGAAVTAGRAAAVEEIARAEPTPTEVADEPSDGVVRHHIATAETAPVRRRPPADRVDDDRPGDATGEITMPRQRPPIEVRHSEPSILIADLAVAHAAVSGVFDKPAAAATPDAASPMHEEPVAEVLADAAEVHGDAAVFSDVEEAFFSAGHSRDEAPPAPSSESFDDLDEDYRRVGFWERFRGKPGPKRPGR